MPSERSEIRYLALLDILGYRQATSRNSLETMLFVASTVDREVRGESMEGLRDSHDPALKVRHFVYADSILLFVDESSEHAFNGLVQRVGELIAWLSQRGILLRGAISKGELVVSPSLNAVLGNGLVRAFDLGHKQDWMGAVVDPELADGQEQVWLSRLQSEGWLVPYAVPIKGGHTEHLLAVAWPIFVESTLESLARRMEGLAGAPRGADIGKHVETHRFFANVKKADNLRRARDLR